MRKGSCVAIASVALAFSGAKAHAQQAGSDQPPAQKEAQQTQQQAKDAYEQAQKAQSDAKKGLDEASKAQEDVGTKRQELMSAEQKAQEASQQAQDAQQRATQKSDQAHQNAAQSQQQGAQAQQRSEQQAKQQEEQQKQGVQQTERTNATSQTASGDVLEVNAQEVVVAQPGKPALHVKIDERTPITMDGSPSSRQRLQRGTHVNVSYRLMANQAVADRVEGSTTM